MLSKLSLCAERLSRPTMVVDVANHCPGASRTVMNCPWAPEYIYMYIFPIDFHYFFSVLINNYDSFANAFKFINKLCWHYLSVKIYLLLGLINANLHLQLWPLQGLGSLFFDLNFSFCPFIVFLAVIFSLEFFVWLFL